jgi:outer membrane protein assembly factor BamA
VKRVLLFLFVSACGPAPQSKTVTQPDRAAAACGGDAVAKQSGHSSLASDLEGLPIVRIDIAGNRLIPATAIAAGSGLEIGKPLSHEGVARAIRQLYDGGELDDIEVFVQHDGAGALVTLVVRERPRIAEIFAPGIPEARKLEMAKWLGIEPGKAFDVAEVQTQRRTIAAGMAEKGASLDVRVHVLRDNQVDVCILVKN